MYEPEGFTFFWDGPFSQWYECYFEIEDVEYNCAEQYMMAEKARLFGDDETLELIMETDVPRTQKALGRQVDGFEKHVWEDDDTENGRPYCWNVVWQGNHAKFTQNDYLRHILLATAGTTLVEASPEDAIWGIGLAEGDPRLRLAGHVAGPQLAGRGPDGRPCSPVSARQRRETPTGVEPASGCFAGSRPAVGHRRRHTDTS